MKINLLFCLIAGTTFCALSAENVLFKEDVIVLPTYAPGGYDKTPLFYTGRVYQGAQGRVYPYPMQDVLFDGKMDETYKYLTLQNKWFHVGLLPEHGGHLLNFTDKATGFETFYRQHVVKPALIGMLGAWISGGVEWNFPHHHRATTAMPIDWRAVANEDGSKTIWIGETELRRRLKWTIGLSLLPDRAVLRAENVFMNRNPWIESMIYWANVSVHCDENYQILFPPSMHVGFDHHKNYWTSYPIGPRKEEIELLPSQRSKYANDIEGMMDLSWWKNFTIESRSIFGLDPDNAFMAGYDHKKKCGTAHVSNRHITVGKKFFLWGNFPEAQVWDKVLTDNDGPYLELMVGCWSDNQPDYSWIAPYETRKVTQYWFPVKGIGGIKNVTVDGAVNVDRTGKDEMLVGFHSTRALEGCTVTLAKGSEKVFVEKNVKIDPDTPWCRPIKVDPAAKDQQFTASIADKDGKVFLSYTPVPPQGEVKLPPKVENPKEPKEYMSAELAYHVGLRLDQFHNGILDPVPYYKRALEIDPDYSKANLAMGVRLAKNGSYAEAKPYLEKAVARATQNHTRALDAAPEYYLALVERALGNLKRAEDLFWRCTWRLTHKKESYVEIARIAALKGDWREALARIDDALALGQDEAKLWTMKGVFLRMLGRAACPQAADGALGTTRPTDANVYYYLGSILWNMDQKTPALMSWKIAAKLNPRHALALRCIGFAISHPGTYFTNTGVPSGIPSREAYDWYVKSLEAEPHFRTLDEAGKLAEKLNLPAAERLALMEKYIDTVNKYDPCILRLAYTYNAAGRYAEAYRILTTRRFHVWEGADGLLAPFIDACHGLGRLAMEAGRALCPQSAADGALGTTRPTGSMSNAAAEKYRLALKYFEESTTYPENLQAGRPGDAGVEPKSRYFMAQCKKALGDTAGYKAELENSLKGWIHAGEMDYWRVKALRELGRDSETAPLIAELRQAIKELETPPPTVINAYAKFAGDNSAMERAAKARFKAGELRKLLKEIE